MTAPPIQFVRAKPSSPLGQRLLADAARRATAEDHFAEIVAMPSVVTRTFVIPKKVPSGRGRGRPSTKLCAIDADGNRLPFDSIQAALKFVGRTSGCSTILLKAVEKKKWYRGYLWERI